MPRELFQKSISPVEKSLLSSIFPSTPRRAVVDRSTHKLAAAILVQALKDALSVGRRSAETGVSGWRKDALEWFFSSDRQPGSFHWVSEVMETNAESFRTLIRSCLHGNREYREQIRRRIQKTRLMRPG